jgi:hypothetical protein
MAVLAGITQLVSLTPALVVSVSLIALPLNSMELMESSASVLRMMSASQTSV